jgi:acyl-CoA thioesterase
MALPEFDPFWERVVEADILVSMHASDSGYTRYTNDWTGYTSEMLPFRLDPFRMMMGKERPITDTMTAMTCHGLFSRFPDLRILSVENGAEWVHPFLEHLEDTHKKMPQLFQGDPVEQFKHNVYVSPFHEDDFSRVADARRPLYFEVDEASGGRTFTTLLVRALQDGRLCATGTFLLDVTAPDVVRHEAGLPPTAAAGPDAAEPFDMGVTGRELRFVDAAYTGDPDAPVGPPEIDAWVRFRAVPGDPAIHAALLAQFTGHIPIAASLRPHAGVGQDQAHRTLSTAINAIAISFHADARADRWMLYHHESTFAGDGMTHAACRVHDEDGRLLASFSVDAMVRAFRSGGEPVDERTSL